MQTTPTISLCSNPLPESHVAALAEIEDGYWWLEGRTYWAQQLITAALTLQGRKSQDSTFLDLGCGTGGFARQIAARLPFAKTVLADGDPKVLELASRFPGSLLHHIDLNSNFTLPVEASIITCMDVIEHLPHDEAFLKQLAQQMPNQGSLIVSVPAYPSFYTEWDRQLGHFRRYTPSHLRSVLENAGLQIQFLSPMWSFLTPAVPIRKMKAARYRESMEFEKVPGFINSLLVQLSKLEWAAARLFRMPVGTSLIAWVTKNG